VNFLNIYFTFILFHKDNEELNSNINNTNITEDIINNNLIIELNDSLLNSNSNIFNDSDERMYSQPLLSNPTQGALNQNPRYIQNNQNQNFNPYINNNNNNNNNTRAYSSNYQQYQYVPPANRTFDKIHSSQSQFRVRSYRVLPPVSADNYSNRNNYGNIERNAVLNNNFFNNNNNNSNDNNNTNLNLLTNNNIGIYTSSYNLAFFCFVSL
jgi:hypothetical protein